jgi:nuclear transport factor 2 (NTF2) superfamily protein
VSDELHPPLPPFTRTAALAKIRAAEDVWNTRNPERVSASCTEDSRWHDRTTFLVGRQDICAFLEGKWSRCLECRIVKELWAVEDDRIAVRFSSECLDDGGNWFQIIPVSLSSDSRRRIGPSTQAWTAERLSLSVCLRTS